MKDDKKLIDSEFGALFSDVKPIKQQTHHFKQQVKTKQALETSVRKVQADSYFSDLYHPLLPTEGPMKWSNVGVEKIELKHLRRGDYSPDLLLDLHGMRQAEAKLEIVALIQASIKQQSQCCCIMHGYGSGILKQQVPMWLAQHPNVLAFHQAPKEWGGDAALLVLLDIGEQPHRR
ncbi:endonuclease SmrB [Shewanella intestini]|uniref:Ribosome rescue factor SmrB n=2 Tax=Shewanellaceae TaxID=267890 RepID=A0ABS5I291_9GAMM|nr:MULTISPECIES: endonuclease SmrB [Shewanella]MBR9727475.1 endonuclease SmrB [Shewanella intestini]MRG35475.1 endonuclease SmrB [Shewanella sp. XMDDZSB0408]